MRKIRESCRFSSVSSLKEHLTEALQEVILDVGYNEPGHGLKGRQVWLVEDADVIEMYSRFKKRQCITLWCFVRKPDQPCTNSSRKRDMPAENVTSQSKRGCCEQTISEVEDMVKKLEEKHGEAYTVEKLNVWAHMLHIKRHSSYDEPPNVP